MDEDNKSRTLRTQDVDGLIASYGKKPSPQSRERLHEMFQRERKRIQENRQERRRGRSR